MSTRFDLLLHPVRMQILQAFAAGRVLSMRDLRARLANMPPELLQHHFGELVAGGALVVAGERPGDEDAEPLYRLDKAASITPTDLRMATPADHLRYFTTFVAGLLATYSRYLRRPKVDPVEDGVSVREMTLHLTSAELNALKQDLYERIQREASNELEGERRTHVLAWVIVPEEHQGESS